MSELAYRKHHYVANSDLKSLKSSVDGSELPPNLDRIFEFGTLVHELILEPHKANFLDPDIQLGLRMRDTFMEDSFCNAFVTHHKFKAEHEFYRNNLMGVSAKCRMDGRIFYKKRRDILEFKSLAVTTQKAFDEALYHFDYDMGAAFYLDVSKYNRILIAGVSKKKPDRLFKMVADRNSDFYKSGLEKYTKWLVEWKQLLG